MVEPGIRLVQKSADEHRCIENSPDALFGQTHGEGIGLAAMDNRYIHKASRP
jgi:hypothetical protein